jgi:hypothetical protein
VRSPLQGEKQASRISNGLTLEVTLNQECYYVGEPIYLHLRLKNDSDGTLPVVPLKVSSSDIAGNLGIVMSREDGVREYHPPYVQGALTPISHTAELLPLLEPRKSWIIVVELLSYFSKEKELIARPEDRIRVGAGTYHLEAFYRWDYQPNVVVRSNTLKVSVTPPPIRERWKKFRVERAIRGLKRGNFRDDPIRICQEVYSREYSGLRSKDLIRAAVRKGLEKDLLGAIGALTVIVENEESPPYLLYDLITYQESFTEGDEEVVHRFLNELIARWPDRFLGEVARQKILFEEIALGGIPSATRSKKED